MAEPYDLTPIPKKKWKKMQKDMKGKGGSPGQTYKKAQVTDYFSIDNDYPV